MAGFTPKHMRAFIPRLTGNPFLPLPLCAVLLLVLLLAQLLCQGCASSSQGSPVYSLSSPQEAPRSATTIAGDALVLTRIKMKIRSDDLVTSQGAKISVHRGVVFMDGTCVDHYQSRMLADLIRTVDGVVRVENRLQPTRTGTRFFSPNGFAAEKIRLHLQGDPELARMDIRVTATNHQVMLTGMVGNRDQRQRASAIAQSFAGNRQVVNHLEVMGD